MNPHIVPEFNMEDDGYSIPTSSDFFFDKHLKMPEEELGELLWQNGQVVMHNQTQRPPRKTPVRFFNGDGSAVLHHVLPDKSAAEDGDGGGGAGPSSAPGQLLHIQEDEMASWLQYPIDDSFDRDFSSDLLYPPAGSCPPVAPIPPPDADKVAANFAHFSLLTGKAPQAEPPRVSTSTATTSAAPPADMEVGGGDPPVTSSSGGFGDWQSNAPAANDRKRKREGDELEGQKELSLRIGCRDDGEKNSEFDHIEEKQPPRLPRRTRAAEVHNLSERRRRDRINEKMKALQELIPHCNKSDKASMLDEAIEYLKSLQFQVQMMSMGCGMAPMVYPGVQHYISPMGMRVGVGMGMAMDMASGRLNRPMLPFQPVLPPMPIHGVASHLGQRLPIPPLQMPRIPLSDQPRACSTSQTDAAFNLVALQIPNAQPLMNLPDPYQHYLSFHPMPMAPQTETTVTGLHTSATTEAPDSKKSGGKIAICILYIRPGAAYSAWFLLGEEQSFCGKGITYCLPTPSCISNSLCQSATIAGHTEAVLAVSFSPDSQHLASGSGDTMVRLWDLNTQTPLYTCSGHKNWVLCIAWSPDGKHLVNGSKTGELLCWDPKTGKQLGNPLTGHKKWITGISWEPVHLQSTSRLFVSASKDGDARIWDVSLKRCVIVLSGHTLAVTCVKWGGDGIVYIGSQDCTIKVWETTQGKLIRELKGHGHWVNSLAISTEYVLRTGAFDHTKKSFSSPDKMKEAALERYNKMKNNGSERLVSGSDDFTMILWEPAVSKHPKARLTGHQQLVNHPYFSPDGKWIVSASFDKSVKLWNGSTGAFVAAFHGHVGPVYQISWSADSRLLLSGSKDSTLKIFLCFTSVWDIRTRKLKQDLPGHADEVFSVDWSPDGQKVASGGKDRVLKLWMG